MLYMWNEKVKRLRYRAVHWSASGCGQLTVNLSIWFLTAIALNNRYVNPHAEGAHGLIPNLAFFHRYSDGGDNSYIHPVSGITILADQDQMELRHIPHKDAPWAIQHGYVPKLPLGKISWNLSVTSI